MRAHGLRERFPLYVLVATLPPSVEWQKENSKMPSIISNTPFLSLRHDENCGRKHAPVAAKSSSSPLVNGDLPQQVNGVATPSKNVHEDEFLRLSRPQQDVLLLHGPRKRYSLERAQEVPELKHERELLVQVLAIGLNPVDWKGPDYGMARHFQLDCFVRKPMQTNLVHARFRTAVVSLDQRP